MGRAKKTDEQYKEEVKVKFNGKYSVLGEYKGNDSRIKIICNHCQTIQETTAGYVIGKNRTYGCRECKRLAKEEKYIRQVKEAVGDEYILLGKYKTTEVKVEMKHQKCGNVWGILPHSFLGLGTRCPECHLLKRSQYSKKEIEDFRNKFIENMGEEYTLQSDYRGQSSKVKIKHEVCGFEDEIIARSITDLSYRCPLCSISGGLKLDTDLYKKRVRMKREDYGDYKLMSEYIDAKTKVKIKHLICGKEFLKLPSNFYTTSCPHCYGTHLRTQEQFEREVYEIMGDGYTVIGNYVRNNHGINIKHNECGRIYCVKPHSILRGHGCRSCNTSKGEESIKMYLENNNIPYKREYTFKDLYYRENFSKLRYDFGVFDREGRLTKLIEFDGEQHERPVEYFGGYEAFRDLQKRDKIKNNYALGKGYKLYRIPYRELINIDTVLEDIIYNKSIKYLVT